MSNTKTEKVIIIGPSGSGKDFLLNGLVEFGLPKCIKYTTRPPRVNEENGVTYNFVSDEEFDKLSDDDLLLTEESFLINESNGNEKIWKYGILKNDFDKSQAIIMTPGEFSMLSEDVRKNCFVVYLDIEPPIRESRLLERNDTNDSVERRMKFDEKDFSNFKDYDLKVCDPDFSSEDIYNLMY